MLKRFFLFSVLFLFFISSCSKRPDGVLSQRKMKAVLTDMHVLDGVFEAKGMQGNERETVYYYNALLQKYGITKADFDSSLVYYTKNPKRFERIYVGVMENIEGIETDIKSGKFHPLLPDSSLLKPIFYDIWNKPVSYAFTPDSARQHLYFSIQDKALLTRDIYHLSFLLRLAPQDSSKNTYAALRIHYADGSVDSLSHTTVNDSILRRYRFRFRASRNIRIDSLSGVLLGSSDYAGKFGAVIDSISLKREYLPGAQDSLRLHLDSVRMRIDSIGAHKDSVRIRKDTVSRGIIKNPLRRQKKSPENKL